MTTGSSSHTTDEMRDQSGAVLPKGRYATSGQDGNAAAVVRTYF
jgi:hypothetical protein